MTISLTKEIRNAAKTLTSMIFDVPKKQKTKSKSIKKIKKKPKKMKKLSSFY